MEGQLRLPNGFNTRRPRCIGKGRELHLAMDFANNYGVHPFWPLSGRWFYGDTIFIIEPLWLVLLIPVLAHRLERRWLKVLLWCLLAALLAVLGLVMRSNADSSSSVVGPLTTYANAADANRNSASVVTLSRITTLPIGAESPCGRNSQAARTITVARAMAAAGEAGAISGPYLSASATRARRPGPPCH